MIHILNQSLAAAREQVTRLALDGKDTTTAREEVADLEKRVIAEQRRIDDEHAAARAAHISAIRAEGKRIAAETLASLNRRLAAFDLPSHLKA
jgi:hypothetical protein